MRIGHGYDVHRFEKGRKLRLGGITIPCDFGLTGHSDADVLLHAVCDALLGAAALGDIGKYFPDTDDKFKDISSLILLKRTGEILRENGYKIVNIDCTVVAQVPKLAPYTDKMREAISDALGLGKDSIGIKATTEEGLGFTGEKLGMAAHAVCLIESE